MPGWLGVGGAGSAGQPCFYSSAYEQMVVVEIVSNSLGELADSGETRGRNMLTALAFADLDFVVCVSNGADRM